MSFKRELSCSPSPPPSNNNQIEDKNPSVKEEHSTDITEPTTAKKRKTNHKAQVKPAKYGDSRGKKGTWTQEQDSALHSLITKDQGGNEVKAAWNDIYHGFSKLFPEDSKTMNSLQMRWKTKIRAGDTDLSLAEKLLFKQAVADIDGTERALAYAWRFKELGGRDLNKSAVIKLHKMLKSNQLDLELES
ncbi:hypothetical protein TWF481_005252 [Arthrobotrys musiformis]|uniref:Myb-like domain-containing protein n=1 Tax=Arthrobotrys musiformis TaxID=47236 RepID=A0AAV9WF29_9PEZI